MLLFTAIKLLPALRLSRQKTNLSSSHFPSIWSCSTCLVGIIFGGNAVLHLDKKVVQNSENPKVVFSLFETVKLSVLISSRNLYISLKSIKEKNIFVH